MAFLHCCLLFTVVIFTQQQFVASQFLIDKVLLRGVTDDRYKKISTSLYKFTVDLYQEIQKSDEDANVFFSPINIYIALAMIYEGSIEETRRQLESALRPMAFYSDDDFCQTIKSLLDRLSSSNTNCTLNLANRLFYQIGVKVNDPYLKLTKDYFDAGMEAVDFRRGPYLSRAVINHWIDRKTSGRINDLFPRNAINNDTDVALAHAVYFKGSWLHKFRADQTVNLTLKSMGNEQLTEPIMHRVQRERLFYASQKHSFKLVELPYGNRNFSMVIILEEKPDGFKDLLTEELQGNEPIHVFTDKSFQTWLPRFKLQQTTNLKIALQVLGIRNLFENAQLSGVSGSAPLQFTDAYHKAFIVVDESGTEAAQGTALKTETSKSDSVNDDDTIDFNVDRPFMFLIYEKTTGCILFFGHIKI